MLPTLSPKLQHVLVKFKPQRIRTSNSHLIVCADKVMQCFLGFRVLGLTAWGLGLRDIMPTIENHMATKIKNDIGTGLINPNPEA